jgi:hypothetical protein
MFHRLIDKWLNPAYLPCASRHRGRRFRPHIESLENRSLLSFNAPLNLPTDVSPEGITVADLTGNSISDLVVANNGFAGDGTFAGVSILLGNGDGTFQPASNIDVGPHPYAVAVGDFDGDGTPDLAVTHAESLPSNNVDTVSILLGNGNGTFRAGGELQVGMNPKAIVDANTRPHRRRQDRAEAADALALALVLVQDL